MQPLASNARLLFLTVCMVLFWVAKDAQAAERELHSHDSSQTHGAKKT
jgi:hypothetical protein